MWTWLSRVFRSTSAAERAEAEGRIEDAARLYLESGNRAEAVRVLLRAGETARTLEERRTWLVRAYGMARTEELRDEARKGLCLVTLAEAEAAAPRTEDDRRRLRDAAADLERFGLYREAGRAWALLEDREAVVRVLTLAGDVDMLEKVTGDRDNAERMSLRRRAAMEDFAARWCSGDRPGALRELAAWVSTHGDDHEAREALDTSTALVVRNGCCSFDLDGARALYVGRLPARLGRDGDVHLRGATVSRRHAVVRATAEGFTLEDGGSRAGTTLNGVPLAAALPLNPGAVIGIGADVTLRVLPALGVGVLVLEIEHGLDRGCRVVIVTGNSTLPVGSLRFDEGLAVMTPSSAVSLNGQKVALAFTLAHGDRIEAGDHVLRVL